MNRYTRRGVRAQYNPVSFEQFAQAPLMAQQLHDQTIASAMAQQEYLKNLPWHEEEARRIEAELEGKIDSLTNKITSSERGIYDIDGVKELSDIRSYKREKFAPTKSRIETALQNRTDLKKRYQDLVDKNDATSTEMQEALAIFDRQSKEAMTKDGTIGYDGRVLAMDPGINKMIVDYISKLPADKIYQETGWEVDPNRGVWYNRSTEQESNGMPEELKNYAMNYIMQDPKAMAYFNDRAMVAEELYSQKDEMGNIIYGDKYYNPDQFRNEIIKEQIDRASSVAEPFSYRNLKIKENIKNLSDWQLDNFGLTDNTIQDMYFSEGETIPTDFNLDKRIKRVFKDAKGNVVGSDAIDQYIRESIDISNLSEEDKAKVESEVIPEIRKKLAKMIQESPNALTLEFEDMTNELVGGWNFIKNLPARLWTGNSQLNPEYILSNAYDRMRRDGISTPRLSEKDREILREQRKTKLSKHSQNVKTFLENTDGFTPDKLTLAESEQTHALAYENVTTPRIMTWGVKESTYLDPNAQEAMRSNNLASFLTAGNIMVIDENNKPLEGEEAQEWIKEHQDVANIGYPGFVNSGVPDQYLLGTALPITTNDNKQARIIVPTNSEQIAGAAALLAPINQIRNDHNMTLGEPKSVPFRNGIHLEYINTVKNGQAVQLVKPYKIGEDGSKKYLDSDEKPGTAAIYYVDDFADKYINPMLKKYVQTGKSIK